MERIPEWLVEYAKNFLVENGYDSSHDLNHFINVVNYVKKILDYEKEKESFNYNFNRREEDIMYLSGFSHDLIDGKYVDVTTSKEKLITVFKENNYPDKDLEVVLFIIENMSFSKQRKREEERMKDAKQEIEKEEEQQEKQKWKMWGKYVDIVSDADKLDAYRVERVIAYQNHVSEERAKSQQNHRNKDGDLEKTKGWIKTILVKRILEYKDKWLKTDYAKSIAPPLHDAVQEYVDTHLSDVQMFEY